METPTLTPALVESITSGLTCASVKCLVHQPAGVLQLCSGCSGVAYCGQRCQGEGWAAHRKVCSKMKGVSWGMKLKLVTAMISLATEENYTENPNDEVQNTPTGLAVPTASTPVQVRPEMIVDGKPRRKVKAKKKKERTEPLSAYSIFVKEEKQKIDTNSKLLMSVVNQKWSTMTPSQREPYVKQSKEDKLALGENYRKNRERRKKPQQVLKKISRSKKKISTVLKRKPHSEENSELPSICSMLEELKSLDAQMNQKTLIKNEMSKKIIQLQVELEFQVKEINVLDTSMSSFQTKCKLLKKRA